MVVEHALIRGRDGHPALVGPSVVVGPNAHVNGSVIENGAFIATGAALFPESRIGAGAEIRVHGVVQVNTTVAPGEIVPIGWIAVGTLRASCPRTGTSTSARCSANSTSWARSTASIEGRPWTSSYVDSPSSTAHTGTIRSSKISRVLPCPVRERLSVMGRGSMAGWAGVDADFDGLVAEAVSANENGWDFSWLAGRTRESDPSWSYVQVARAAILGARSLLDVDTAGGELLAALAPLPPKVVATNTLLGDSLPYRPSYQCGNPSRLASTLAKQNDVATTIPPPESVHWRLRTRLGAAAIRPRRLSRRTCSASRWRTR